MVLSSESSELPELLRQAGETLLNTRGEMRAMAKAAAVDQLEEGLVRLAVAESWAHIQEQQQSSIETPPWGTASSASIASG
jgi:Sec-independent protein translocase protein TatA